MPLPQHISEALRCDPNLDEDELLEFLDNAVADQLPWFLHDQEAKSSLCGAVFGNTAALSSEIFELKGAPPELKFITVFQDAAQFRALLLVPDVEFLTTAIPTAALVCIAKCWPSNANFLDVRNPSVIPDGLKRKAVIFLLASGLQGWEQSNLIDTLLSLAGYVTEDATAARAGPPDWTASSTFEFGGGALVSSEPMMAGRLLQESIRESRVRWRFIALYRICEAAYLVSLKEQFTRDFLDSPGSVLSE